MATFTKRGVDVFAPTTAGGALRHIINEDAQAWSTEVERNIDASALGLIQEPTWALLSGNTRQKAQGQPGRVTGPDTGTHTGYYVNDAGAIVSGNVQNTGEYSWSAAHNAWVRVGDTNIEQLQEDIEELQAQTGETQTSLTDLLDAVRTHLLPVPRVDQTLSSGWINVLAADGDGNVEVGIDKNGVLWAESALAPGVTGLSDDMFYEWRTEDGYRLFGFDGRGNLHAQIATAPGEPGLADNLIYAWITEGGYLLFGFDGDGRFVSTGSSEYSTRVFAHIIDGVSRVFAIAKGGNVAPITFGERPSFAPVVVGIFVEYMEDGGGTFAQRREEIKASTSLSQSIRAIRMIIVYGQSLSDGTTAREVVSVEPVRPGVAVMFEGGTRPRGSTPSPEPIPHERLYSLVDARELSSGEHPGSQLVNIMTDASKGWPTDHGGLVAGFGQGGYSYAELKRGTQPYNNILTALRRARIIADLNGLDFLPPVMTWDQGQANFSNTNFATYLGYLIELQANITEDWARYSGSTDEVLLAVNQLSTWTAYNRATHGIPLAQLQAALDNPGKIICTGPQYMLETQVDGIHLTGPSSARSGAYQGRAIRQHLTGVPWLPLHIASAVRTGAEIVLTYAGGDAMTDIEIDTTLVSDPGNLGFEWSQTGGTARTISNVAKTGMRQITVTLSGNPGTPSSSTIGYAVTGIAGAPAGPMTGARGNIRDGSPDLTAFGEPMHNWACHQLISL